MKARWPTTCECCGRRVEVGSRISTYAGRPWLTTHLVEYQMKRTKMRGKQ